MTTSSTSFRARVLRSLTGRPVAVLAVVAAFVLLCGAQARHLKIDAAIEALLPSDDPELALHEKVTARFGSDDLGVIGVFAEDVYRAPVLETIQRITDRVAALQGIADVVSLTNAPDPVADVTSPPLLIADLPRTQAESDAIRAKLLERPIYLRNLVSADGRGAGINLFFDSMSDEAMRKIGVDEAIEAILEAERRPGVEIFYTGLPHFRLRTVEAMFGDLSRVVPLAFLVILFVLFLSFRNLRGVALPALSALSALACTLGAMGYFGRALSLGNIALPPLVLIIAAVYALHVVSEFMEHAAPGRDPREVVAETLAGVGTATVITALTTVLGFLSLAVNRIDAIRDLGIFAALGITLSFVFALTLVPAALACMPMPRPRPELPLEGHLKRLGRIDLRHRSAIGRTGMVVIGLALSQLPWIRADTNFQSFYRASDPIRVATDRINEGLVGSMGFTIVLDGGTPDAFKKWDTLRAVRDFQDHLEAFPGVDDTVSFVDYVELLDRGAARGGGGLVLNDAGELVEVPVDDDPTTLWENPEQLTAPIGLVILNPAPFARVVDAPFEQGTILVRTSLARSSDIEALVAEVRDYAANRLPKGLSAYPTGKLVLLTRTSSDVVEGQIWSLAIATVAIFGVVSGLFLSWRIGVLAMVPNLFPIAAFFGLVGGLGIDLNLGTSIVASIALGIAVDDTIHVLTRLSSEVRRGADAETAIVETLATVGKPVFYTTAMLVPGFLTLALSTFVPLVQFGVLAAATMLFALVGDLVLLPALVGGARVITLWDLLALKLGDAPERTIPLFEGLRAWQARVVVLLGRLTEHGDDEAVVRQGESGDELHVLLSGQADVVVRGDASTRVVRRLARGDVFGEMSLLGGECRSADVISKGSVETLALDVDSIERLRRRYPYTANQILFNIARILSERLRGETQR